METSQASHVVLSTLRIIRANMVVMTFAQFLHGVIDLSAKNKECVKTLKAFFFSITPLPVTPGKLNGQTGRQAGRQAGRQTGS